MTCFLWARLVVLVTLIKMSQSASCLKTCTGTLKSSIVSIVGHSPNVDMQFLAPFHAIIGKSRTTLVAGRKISWLCHNMKRFDDCAKRCPQSRAKALRMSIVQQWNSICDASQHTPKAFSDFLGCERHHYDITSSKCTSMKISLGTPLNSFCEQLNEYAQCYMQVPFKCSINGTEIWKKVNRSIRKSYDLLLGLSSQHLKIPEGCTWMMSAPMDSEEVLTTTSTTTTWRPSTRLFTGWQPEYRIVTSTSGLIDYWVDLEPTFGSYTIRSTPEAASSVLHHQTVTSKNSYNFIEWSDLDQFGNVPTTPVPTTKRLGDRTRAPPKTNIINPRQKPSSDALNSSPSILLSHVNLILLICLLFTVFILI